MDRAMKNASDLMLTGIRSNIRILADQPRLALQFKSGLFQDFPPKSLSAAFVRIHGSCRNLDSSLRHPLMLENQELKVTRL